MLVACTQNGTLDHAKAVFSEMPLRSVVSWNAMLAMHLLLSSSGPLKTTDDLQWDVNGDMLGHEDLT